MGDNQTGKTTKDVEEWVTLVRTVDGGEGVRCTEKVEVLIKWVGGKPKNPTAYGNPMVYGSWTIAESSRREKSQ